MTKETGGSAFPCTDQQMNEIGHDGMTLRDYFAGMTLQAILLAYNFPDANPNNKAEMAYKLADALIEARKS